MGVTFNTIEFEKNLEICKEKTRAAGKRGLMQNALDLEKEAKGTAPILEGTLIGDIVANPVILDIGDGGMEAQVHAGTGESRDYALRQHEELKPAGTMTPGHRTSKRPPKPWGPAGGKYLERPLKHKAVAYAQNIARHISGVK